MNIYIDITRLLRYDKVEAYNAEVHWEMDDFDTISKSEMDELKRRLQYEVDRTFSGSTHVAETHSKKVYQYSSDGTFIRKWSSANEIERQTGFNQDSICDCCNGKHESAYGFVWRYAT